VIEVGALVAAPLAAGLLADQGQHGAEILTELGLGARIAELRAAGVVA
jgi:hypothetical protein